MENNGNRFTLEQIREIDIVKYLSSVGHEPVKIRGNDFWYLSPLRQERTPSFKVNRTINAWFDHGIGRGGNLIDFALLYHSVTVGEFAKLMNGSAHIEGHRPTLGAANATHDNRVLIESVRPIVSVGLLKYVQQRRIDLEVADRFCSEVTYTIGQKKYFGIGLKNDRGGWALRNPFMKSASHPNGPTTIVNSSSTVVIIEGMFDFLSYQTIFKNMPEASYDFQVLNSVNNLEASLPKIGGYAHGIVLVDNDEAGQNVTETVLGQHPSFTDGRPMFAAHNDINEWLCNVGMPISRSQRPRI